MGLAVGAVAIFPCAAGLCSFAEEEEAGNTPAGSRLLRRGSLASVDSSQADG